MGRAVGDMIVCPFLEQADSRCAAHLCLNKLEEAMGRCGDNYEDCPIYRDKLLGNVPPPPSQAEPVRAAG